MSERSAGRRLFSGVLRLLLVLVVGAGLGAAAYFGLPLAYRGLVEPVQLNAERIQDLEADLERTRADLTELAERSGERTAELEASNAQAREALAELQAGLEGDLSGLQSELDGLSDRLDALDDELSAQVAGLEQAVQDPDESQAELQRQLAVNRALLHLMRARLWLIENNLGLAAEQVRLARSALSGLQGLEPVVQRLDQALAELQTTPLVAAEDLEIAWMMLTTEPES